MYFVVVIVVVNFMLSSFAMSSDICSDFLQGSPNSRIRLNSEATSHQPYSGELYSRPILDVLKTETNWENVYKNAIISVLREKIISDGFSQNMTLADFYSYLSSDHIGRIRWLPLSHRAGRLLRNFLLEHGEYSTSGNELLFEAISSDRIFTQNMKTRLTRVLRMYFIREGFDFKSMTVRQFRELAQNRITDFIRLGLGRQAIDELYDFLLLRGLSPGIDLNKLSLKKESIQNARTENPVKVWHSQERISSEYDDVNFFDALKLYSGITSNQKTRIQNSLSDVFYRLTLDVPKEQLTMGMAEELLRGGQIPVNNMPLLGKKVSDQFKKFLLSYNLPIERSYNVGLVFDALEINEGIQPSVRAKISHLFKKFLISNQIRPANLTFYQLGIALRSGRISFDDLLMYENELVIFKRFLRANGIFQYNVGDYRSLQEALETYTGFSDLQTKEIVQKAILNKLVSDLGYDLSIRMDDFQTVILTGDLNIYDLAQLDPKQTEELEGFLEVNELPTTPEDGVAEFLNGDIRLKNQNSLLSSLLAVPRPASISSKLLVIRSLRQYFKEALLGEKVRLNMRMSDFVTMYDNGKIELQRLRISESIALDIVLKAIHTHKEQNAYLYYPERFKKFATKEKAPRETTQELDKAPIALQTAPPHKETQTVPTQKAPHTVPPHKETRTVPTAQATQAVSTQMVPQIDNSQTPPPTNKVEKASGKQTFIQQLPVRLKTFIKKFIED